MINAFVTSFKLRNTYKTNSIIYSLKSIPLVKRILPDSLYASRGLKVFANVVSILLEIGSIFLGKALYLLLMVFMAAELITLLLVTGMLLWENRSKGQQQEKA